ncbi:hypothetical protein [Streptomyces sp. NPDC057280]
MSDHADDGLEVVPVSGTWNGNSTSHCVDGDVLTPTRSPLRSTRANL